jgi:large subunit ribosomal protein L35
MALLLYFPIFQEGEEPSMPKLKTKQKAAKRFRITKNGKVLAKGTGRRHLLGDKPKKLKRHMRFTRELPSAVAPKIKKQLPYA